MSTSPPGTYPETAAEIKAQCAHLGISQAELARRVGVATVTVNRWATGATRPDPRTLRAIKAMRKRIEVNVTDLEAALDWFEAGQPITDPPPTVFKAFDRLRRATKGKTR